MWQLTPVSPDEEHCSFHNVQMDLYFILPCMQYNTIVKSRKGQSNINSMIPRGSFLICLTQNQHANQ